MTVTFYYKAGLKIMMIGTIDGMVVLLETIDFWPTRQVQVIGNNRLAGLKEIPHNFYVNIRKYFK